MATTLQLGDIVVDVIRKDIKNLHLSVLPPTGRVRIAAPLDTNAEAIRLFAISKLGWIKQQQKKRLEQERESPREYLDRESHYLWGRRYLLKVIEHDGPPRLSLDHRRILLEVRPDTGAEKRQETIDAWYRAQIKQAVPPLIARWEPLIGVKVGKFFIQRMKTRWGSCSHVAGNIRLNTELAKKPRECLEYIVVHEMTHLLEPTHNPRFVSLLDQFMPKWRFYRDQLNRLPVRHEQWGY